MVTQALGPFWVALTVSALLSYPLLQLMRKVKAHAMISQYTPEHASKAGTPSMGGIAPLLALITTTGLILNGSSSYLSRVEVDASFKWPTPILLSILIALIGFGAMGVVDDFLIPRLLKNKRGFGWTQKLFLQVVVVAIILYPLQPLPATTSLIIGFCVLFFANAVNFADGLDGLCGGLLLVATSFFIPGITGFVAQAMMGALIPFLFLNAPPAKIFMGDVGALAFGATFGLLFANSLWLEGAGGDYFTTVPSVLVLSLVFILELALVPLQLFWVKVFKKRLIPASPVHHSFEKIGWPETRITAIFILAQVVLTALAISLAPLGWWRL